VRLAALREDLLQDQALEILELVAERGEERGETIKLSHSS
jgi:hypothetical protein